MYFDCIVWFITYNDEGDMFRKECYNIYKHNFKCSTVYS